MIIDAHAHYHPRAYTAALAGLEGGGRGGGFPGAPDTDDADHIARRLEVMDEADVRLQVLSPAAGRAPYSSREAAAVEAAHLINDASADLEARYPQRFRAFVSLPLPHIDASLRELQRGMDELGMLGVNLHTAALTRSIAEAEFLPIYEEINRRKGVVFFHPAANGLFSPLVNEYGLTGAVGTTLEDAMLVLHLIARRIPSQFPDITFIVPHLGGPLAMMLSRLDNQFPAQADLPEKPSVTAKRLYYDTVVHGSHAALECAWKEFGAGHLLAGSEYPVLLAVETYARSLTWIRDTSIPVDDQTQIIERTAPALLGLDR